MISLDPDCAGESEGTVHHEVMHALGVHHEHVRADRDDYIDVFLDNTNAAVGNFEKVAVEVWETTNLS